MKYDVLDPFREYLYQNLSKNTARKYYSSIIKIFQNLQFNNVLDINQETIIRELTRFKTKNEFSAIKNSLIRFKNYYPELDLPDDKYFKEISRKKRNWSKKPKKIIYLDETKRKINQIKNEKLKLAYRLALVSGLRVSELSFLEPEDITFDDGKIIVNVRNGKGGSNGYIDCMSDPYLYKKLKEYVGTKEPAEKIFYSESYMRERADRLGMECHDFRRIFAINYRNQLKREMPVEEANRRVQEMLRHRRFSTTKRYLFNRKLIFKKTKEREGESNLEEE